jgi:hypothetical protein
MKPESSLPHSQLPATCLYPEPAQSSPHPTSHFLKIHPTIILPSTPGSPHWSPSLRVSQNPVHASLLPHPCYMPCPSHSQFYHPHNTAWGIQIIKLIMKFSPLPCYLIPLMPKYSPRTPYSQTPSAYVPLSMSATKFHTHMKHTFDKKKSLLP